MEKLEIACVSSRGQMVIPQKVREDMHIQDGEKFAVIWHGDTMIFKRIDKPSIEGFKALLDRLSERARAAGITPKDVEDAIRKARGRK